MRRYRVLSLDGGGSWAIIQAIALRDLCGDVPGHQLLRRFDVVAANSGGSLVLAGLLENLTPTQIESLFLNRAAEIFRPARSDLRLLGLLGFGPRYSSDGKLKGLRKLLPHSGDQRLDDVAGSIMTPSRRPLQVLITSFDYDRRRAVFFRSNRQSRAGSFSSRTAPTLAEAVHASANAPVLFFDKPAEFPVTPDSAKHRFWDGAVAGYNNPVVAAVIEAMANLPDASGRLDVLSIGTGEVVLPLVDQAQGLLPPLAQRPGRSTLLGDTARMATSILDDPPDVATFVAHMMLDGRLPRTREEVISDGCVIRVSPMVQPVQREGRWAIPRGLSRSEFEALVDLRMDVVQKRQLELLRKLARLWMEAVVEGDLVNRAIRSRADFSVEIGHRYYFQTRSAWQIRSGSPAEPNSANQPVAGLSSRSG